MALEPIRMPSGIASTAAMPRPSAQPCSVLPTALQKSPSPSSSASSATVADIDGTWSSLSRPMPTTSCHRASTQIDRDGGGDHAYGIPV